MELRCQDGTQDENEPGIPGVVLEIQGPDGKPVTDVFGNPVGPVTTDENGNYLFEELPVLPAGKSYTVTISPDQPALAKYLPTVSGAGKDSAKDSSTWNEKTTGLTNDGDEDRTLDFGFVTPSVTVGDKVWFDKNGDGRQGMGEPGIEGVVLEITGPDGQPVTDVFGNPVGSVVTDEKGNYLFENLPALDEGQSYRVKININASAQALAGLVPTLASEGDREGDSSNWEAFTEGLLAHGDSDLTLDFGFVLETLDTPVPPSISETGVAMPLITMGVGGVLLALGLGFALRGRRTEEVA